MAGLVDHMQHGTGASEVLNRLIGNPIFGELQATLATECAQHSVPFTIVQDREADAKHASISGMHPVRGDKENFDLVVEDATLQAEFRQMATLNNDRVIELETFYNSQSAAIMAQRSDAMSRVGNTVGLTPERLEQELQCLHFYYDRQQRHLTARVSRSLQLLKGNLPMELAQPSNAAKKNKSRLLSPKAVNLMADWYDRHQENPYPTDEEKQELAEQGGVSLAQVKAWFANKRNRSLNTRPKRQKMEMQRKMLRASDNMQPGSHEQSAEKNYEALMQEISSLVRETTPASTGPSVLAQQRTVSPQQWEMMHSVNMLSPY